MAYSIDHIKSTGPSYLGLLAALRPQDDVGPRRKKRKLRAESAHAARSKPESNHESLSAENGSVNVPDASPEALQADLVEPTDEADDGDDARLDDGDEGDEEGESLLQDPFEKHYFAAANISETSTSRTKDLKPVKFELQDGLRKTLHRPQKGDDAASANLWKTKDFHLKARLAHQGSNLLSEVSATRRDLTEAVFCYVDVVAAFRTIDNAPFLRDVCCLHALNHVFKTRDRVLKNNAKLAQAKNAESLDLRDQGFTRPKVLMILPTKQACVRYVESIVRLSEPEQQENKSRFLDTFSRQEEDEWQDKPEDFRELFGGNHEEDFRIGLKFTRKTMKYFSGFYNSDIIICSPLGLMRSITAGGGEKEDKKSPDADFLSSIEVAIMDYASALQMQNWQHVEFVFSQFNQLPKESHGCDFSRVRNPYLDGHAKFLRQTIITSSYMTPEINSLVSSHLYNIEGVAKYVPSYTGSMLEASSLLPTPVTQTFLRFDSPSPLTDSEKRFKCFSTTILPQLLRDQNSQQGTLLFVPDYADFTRLRNHLSTSAEGTSLSFGSISEYTPMKDVSRARSHLMSGRHSLLLYSERAHHHFRYRIRGVAKIVFYGIPENPIFWNEVVSFLALGESSSLADGKGKNLVRALFSRWDMMKLERIVGSDRVGKLISERVGDVFDFV